jgi:anaerobic dimethyl sulfoxide reductase subunit B (iron-sulfur subunit)
MTMTTTTTASGTAAAAKAASAAEAAAATATASAAAAGADFGLLIDYAFCTGCHSCEMACSIEHGLPIGRKGIEVQTVGPWEIEGDLWQYDYLPVPTLECDLCAARTAKGKLPTCVHHCQAQVMAYGRVSELALQLAAKPRQCLFVPCAAQRR